MCFWQKVFSCMKSKSAALQVFKKSIWPNRFHFYPLNPSCSIVPLLIFLHWNPFNHIQLSATTLRVGICDSLGYLHPSPLHYKNQTACTQALTHICTPSLISPSFHELCLLYSYLIGTAKQKQQQQQKNNFVWETTAWLRRRPLFCP